MRGKSRDAPHYTGQKRREVTHVGSVLTSDIVTMTDAGLGTGVGGYKYALVIRSLFGKGFQGYYPLKRRRTEDAYWAIKHFVGQLQVDLLYTDDAKEYKRSARMLGIPWDRSVPGQPKSNSIAESLVGVSTDTVRACCVTAGFPSCLWPFVGPTQAIQRNAWTHEDGVSAHF